MDLTRERAAMSMFVCERYLPGSSMQQVTSGADRIHAATAELARQGSKARLLSSTFVPEEEWMFELFDAGSDAEVQRVYATAGVDVERISRAIDALTGRAHVPGRSV